jgi:UDP-N-acetylmuramoyl-L-alanyl-D-glutamate--2,6-diaminopimelate ligase
LQEKADVRAEVLDLTIAGSRLALRAPWGEAEMNLRLLGRFNVQNALAALSAAHVLGIEPEAAMRTLSTMSCVRGRMEPVTCGGGFSVYVDYAHTDDALRNVLVTLRELRPSRILLVFGCGGNRDRTKRPAMGRAAAELADFVFITSDNPRNEDPLGIISEVAAGMNGFSRRRIVEDRRQAISEAISMAREGDVVLIAGKGHETFQESGGKSVPFDDRQVASEELRRLGL